MINQFFYGNSQLQKHGWNISTDPFVSTSGNDVMTASGVRQNGLTVLSTKRQAKRGTIRGSIITDTVANYDKLIKEIDQLLNKNKDQERYFRIVRNYLRLDDLSSTSEWSNSDDLGTLSVNTDIVQEDSSLKGSITTTTNSEASWELNMVTGVDMSSYQNKGNIEASVYVPDVRGLSTISIVIGSSSVNNYFASATNNYEGLPFENGWNHVSFDFATMTVAGTIDITDIDYVRVTLSYNSDFEAQDVYLGMIQWTDEELTRNYPSYFESEMQKEGENYNNTFSNFSLSFLNHTGYAISTHSYELFSDSTTGATETEKFELEGSTDLLPLFRIALTNASDVEKIKLTNIAQARSITYPASSLVADDGDVIQFGGVGKTSLTRNSLKNNQYLDFEAGLIPGFAPGINRLRLDIEATGAETIPPTPLKGSQSVTAKASTASDSVRYVSQSFTATGNLSITNAEFLLQNLQESPVLFPGLLAISAHLMSDSGGQPGTILQTFNYPASGNSTRISLSCSPYLLTNGTKYHIVVQSGKYSAMTGEYFAIFGAETGNAYTSGDCRISDIISGVGSLPTSASSWTVQTSLDLNFKVILEPSPAWDVDYSATYRKLWSS